MKIEFNNINKEKTVTKIKEFAVNEEITIRVIESEERLVLKLRNEKFETTGRALKIEDIQNVNQVIFAGETYDNLDYIQHEIYIHKPTAEDTITGMIEDLNITFRKVA